MDFWDIADPNIILAAAAEGFKYVVPFDCELVSSYVTNRTSPFAFTLNSYQNGGSLDKVLFGSGPRAQYAQVSLPSGIVAKKGEVLWLYFTGTSGDLCRVHMRWKAID